MTKDNKENSYHNLKLLIQAGHYEYDRAVTVLNTIRFCGHLTPDEHVELLGMLVPPVSEEDTEATTEDL